MAPWNLPWSTFGAFLVLACTIVLALVWAAGEARDRDREDRAMTVYILVLVVYLGSARGHRHGA